MATRSSPRAVLRAVALAVPSRGRAGRRFAATSLRFHGNGSADVDRVKIPVDDPADANPGPPADVGAARLHDRVLDEGRRGRQHRARRFLRRERRRGSTATSSSTATAPAPTASSALSIAGGVVVFGVSGDGTGDRTICGARSVLDDRWHHVAVERRALGRLDVDLRRRRPRGRRPTGPTATSRTRTTRRGRDRERSVPRARRREVRRGRRLRRIPRRGPHLDARCATRAPSRARSSPFTADAEHGRALPPRRRRGHSSPATPRAPPAVLPTARSSSADPRRARSGRATAAPLGGRAVRRADGAAGVGLRADAGRQRPRRLLAPLRRGAGAAPSASTRTARCCRRRFSTSTRSCSAAASRGCSPWRSIRTTRPTDTSTSTTSTRSPAPATSRSRATACREIPTSPTRPRRRSCSSCRTRPTRTTTAGSSSSARTATSTPAPATGEAAAIMPNNAQNLGVLLGKMLRIDVNGTGAVPCGQVDPTPYAIPPSNPFAGDAGDCDEIWAYGLRNPWRFSFDRATGDLLIGDVGQELYEEIDFQPAASAGGENYGWHKMEGFHCYNPGSNCNDGTLTLPILEQPHTTGWCAIIGGMPLPGDRDPGARRHLPLFRQLPRRHLFGDEAATGAGPPPCSRRTASTSRASARTRPARCTSRDLGGDKVYRIDPSPYSVPGRRQRRAALGHRRRSGLQPDRQRFGIRLRVGRALERRGPADHAASRLPSSRAAISAEDIAAAGTASVTVFTPAPGGGTSAPLTVDINPTFLDVPHQQLRVPVHPGRLRRRRDGRLRAAALLPGRVDHPGADGGLPPEGGPGLRLRAAAPAPARSSTTCRARAGRSTPGSRTLRLAAITGGCGGGNYCPAATVTRAQMAVFLLKAEPGAGLRAAGLHRYGLQRRAVLGRACSTHGSKTLRLERSPAAAAAATTVPDSSVTRAQMAVFLTKTFNLTAAVEPRPQETGEIQLFGVSPRAPVRTDRRPIFFSAQSAVREGQVLSGGSVLFSAPPPSEIVSC